MVKKQVAFWVDEEILLAFDEVAWKRRSSRTGLLAELMREAAGRVGEEWPDLQRPAKADRRREVVAELKAGLAAERSNCAHPKESRQKFAWGSKCGACGSVLK